ncbi:MAG: HAMP domain-containing histidine kinase [Clostridia bacterium]|nr:HAMP domain-containing histidine kinase [Clostridia bacterium]
MSVKKRLFWSHILMFALPILTYLLFSLLADRLSWMYLLQQRFQTMEDFRHHVQLTEQFSRWFTLGGLVLTLLVVNLMLSRGVLKKIEGSLDQLSEGLRLLREGQLNYRLPDRQEDEFSAVRADFNAAAARLEQLVDEQRQSERNRQELLAGLAHDLRSPLTAVRAYTEGLLDGVAQTEDSRRQYLTIIRDKTRDLQALVNKLFLFSRMDLGRNEDHPEPLSVREELTALHGVLSDEYAHKGMTVTLTVPEESDARVLADPDTLHRIVTNIAENSCKYGASALDITLRQQATHLSVVFADNGPGVPQEALPHIFDAFYRADPARSEKFSGSGLGLAIVSRAVRNMGGRIIAKNQQPQGLLLEIQLPRLEQEV